MGKQGSSRNESFYMFSLDGGKEDWNICLLQGEGGFCVSVAADANQAAGQDRGSMQAEQILPCA